MNSAMPHPRPLLRLRIKKIQHPRPFASLCAGYESGKWRSKELAQHIMEWIPEVVLRKREIESIGSHNMVEMMRRAIHHLSTYTDITTRGEIGEILLHIAIRQTCATTPVISKIFFKDSPGDTVKGYDCVHSVYNDNKLELWLGEAKFYSDIDDAISKAISSLKKATQTDYLRTEFSAILNKIDLSDKLGNRVAELINSHNSLDEIFDKIVIPVLLTYDSETLQRHKQDTLHFTREIKQESFSIRHKFFRSAKYIPVKIILFTIPLNTKQALIRDFLKEATKWA